jgi:hypothetical protein
MRKEKFSKNVRLSLLGKQILSSAVAKDLGVILDTNLPSNEHITSLVSSCMSRLHGTNKSSQTRI